ncbi:MAG: META domain-containing protein [Tannerellaceae bacterium]|nr:META domain-containing protein [Tannerellaceae bacterium]
MRTKKNQTVFIVMIAIAAITMQGCASSRNVALTQKNLEGSWVLKTLNGKDVGTIFSQTKPTLQFDFTEKTIHGTGGCNSYTGRFIMINNLLNSPEIVSTKRFCFGANAEDEFLKAMREDKNLSLKDGILRMTDEKKNVVMEFERPIDMTNTLMTFF